MCLGEQAFLITIVFAKVKDKAKTKNKQKKSKKKENPRKKERHPLVSASNP